jgi:hypothetical protein
MDFGFSAPANSATPVIILDYIACVRTRLQAKTNSRCELVACLKRNSSIRSASIDVCGLLGVQTGAGVTRLVIARIEGKTPEIPYEHTYCRNHFQSAGTAIDRSIFLVLIFALARFCGAIARTGRTKFEKRLGYRCD